MALVETAHGGHIDAMDALIAREEAGLVAARYDAIGTFAPYKGVSNERCHYFLARELTAVPQSLEPEESLTVHRMPLAEAREVLIGQELADGQSLCGLMLLDRFLSRETP